MPRNVDASSNCPECARLSHIGRWGPSRFNWRVLSTVVGGVLFALLSWAAESVLPLWSGSAKLPPLVRVGRDIAKGAFFGVWMYWFTRASLHAKHTGEPADWVAVFWPRLLIAGGLLVVSLILLDYLR